MAEVAVRAKRSRGRISLQFRICRDISTNCRGSDSFPREIPLNFNTLGLVIPTQGAGNIFGSCREEQRGIADLAGWAQTLKFSNGATVILHSTSIVNGARVRDAEPPKRLAPLTPPAPLGLRGVWVVRRAVAPIPWRGVLTMSKSKRARSIKPRSARVSPHGFTADRGTRPEDCRGKYPGAVFPAGALARPSQCVKTAVGNAGHQSMR